MYMYLGVDQLRPPAVVQGVGCHRACKDQLRYGTPSIALMSSGVTTVSVPSGEVEIEAVGCDEEVED